MALLAEFKRTGRVDARYDRRRIAGCGERLGGAFRPGDHGSSFAGGPVVGSAARAALELTSAAELMGRVIALGGLLAAGLGYRDGALIYGYWVAEPRDYAVVALDRSGRPVSIEDRPKTPQSHFAVPGLYFYDNASSAIAAAVRPSAHGELEITDVNREYLRRGLLKVELLNRSFAWIDASTPELVLDAANYIAAVERRQGLKIACIEEIAWRNGWISEAQLARQADRAVSPGYGRYLLRILHEARGA